VIGKRKDIGRGYSNETRVEIALEELPDYFKQEIEIAKKVTPWRVSTDEHGRSTFSTGGWRDSAALAEAMAKAYLDRAELPTSQTIYKWAEDDWREDRPDSLTGWRNLESHFKALGHERDSFPDLAARILSHCDWIKAHHAQGRVDAMATECILLGHACALWNVYSLSDANAARGGKKPKRQAWVAAVADKVSHWEEIPEREVENFIPRDLGIDVIYRDGNTLMAIDKGGKQHSLKRSTFEKRYLRKHNK